MYVWTPIHVRLWTVQQAWRRVQGVYWDTQGGCLRGTWDSGILKGQGIYDQPSYQFKGNFKANLPEGECSFTICAHRSLGMPARAASHILADHGPVMLQKGNYMLPPGHWLCPSACVVTFPGQHAKAFLLNDHLCCCCCPSLYSPCFVPHLFVSMADDTQILYKILCKTSSTMFLTNNSYMSFRNMHLSNTPQCVCRVKFVAVGTFLECLNGILVHRCRS